MNGLFAFLDVFRTSVLAQVALLMFAFGGLALALPSFQGNGGRGAVKRRLRLESAPKTEDTAERVRQRRIAIQEKAARGAQDFYARSDPENVARLRLKLVQAGYMEPRAVGLFFLIRFFAFAATAVAAFVLVELFGTGSAGIQRWAFVLMSGAIGYFLPGLILSQKVRKKMTEYRNGFPDFMDLMIVCADAGMSMEASIERVSRELEHSYPALSRNLQLVSIELRAGRSLDDALKSLSDRLNLDEVRSFATLLQQSKELGTSLSGALRVFSDEMRSKRMSMAEEKAHALPAKMSVPVTVCILPVVVMIAIIPMIVKLTGMD